MGASPYLAGRIIMEATRSRRALVLWVLFPLSMLLLFGWSRSQSAGGLGPAFASTAPGILVGAALFFSCLGGPVSVITSERERGTLGRLGASPMSGSQYFAGLTLAHLAIASGQAALVYGLTYLAGGRIDGSPVGCFLLLLLCTSAYVGVGFIIGTRYTSGSDEINGAVAGIGVPLLVLGGTFFPAESLPPTLFAVAHLNPVFHMNQAFTAVARGEVDLWSVWPNVILLIVFTACSVWLGEREFNRMFLHEAKP